MKLEVYEVAHLTAEGVGESAQHIESNAHCAALNLPQIGMRGTGHLGETTRRQVRFDALRSDVISKPPSAIHIVHFTSVNACRYILVRYH